MPKVPQAHLDMRRDQILVAARSCFFKKGFHQTTMKDIMGTAKLSAGAVYNYFKSKEDIIVAMAEKVVERNPDFIDLPHPEIADLSLADIFATLFPAQAQRSRRRLRGLSQFRPRFGGDPQRSHPAMRAGADAGYDRSGRSLGRAGAGYRDARPGPRPRGAGADPGWTVFRLCDAKSA